MSTPTIALVAIAVLLFSLVFLQRVRQILDEGLNFSPIHVALDRTDGSPLPACTGVSVVTPWKKVVDLEQVGDFWCFPPGERQAAAEISVVLAPRDTASDYTIRFRKVAGSEDCVVFGIHSSRWEDASLARSSGGTDEVGAIYHVADLSFGNSMFSVGRKCLNWKGDFRLLISAASKPALIAGFSLLASLMIMRWRRIPEIPLVHHTAPTRFRQDDRVRGLDALRGVAILMVFAYHGLYASFGFDQLGGNGWFRDFDAPKSFLVLLPLTFGWGGVAIFFVISGFCVHLSWRRSTTRDWRAFFIRRLYRIAPPYWVALALFAFFFPLTRLQFVTSGDFTQYFYHLLGVHNLDARTYWGINGSFWSIAVEAQLYLIYPLLIATTFYFGWGRALWIPAFCEVAINMVDVIGFFGINLSIPYALEKGPFAYWFSWAIGACLAELVVTGKAGIWTRWPLWVWPLATVVSWYLRPISSFGFLFVALSATVLIAHIVNRPENFQWLRGYIVRHLGRLGVISYSFYLFHQPIVNAAPMLLELVLPTQFIHPWIKYGSCMAAYPLIFLLSSLSYRWVELPAIEAGKRAIRRMRTASVPFEPLKTEG